EESVSSEGHLLAHRRSRGGRGTRGGRSRRGSRGRRGRRSGRSGSRLECAVATGSGGGRRPVGIAPAQFVGAVLPGSAGSVDPVVNGLGLGESARGGGGKCSAGEERRHVVQFLHDSPLREGQ